MNRKNRKAVKVQSEGSLSFFCVRLSRQIRTNWECSCSNLLLKPAAAKATRKGRGWALPIAMYILPSWLDTFTACQGQSIDNPQSRLTWDLDQYWLWGYRLIDRSTELLNSKAELKLGSQTRTRNCGTMCGAFYHDAQTLFGRIWFDIIWFIKQILRKLNFPI